MSFSCCSMQRKELIVSLVSYGNGLVDLMGFVLTQLEQTINPSWKSIAKWCNIADTKNCIPTRRARSIAMQKKASYLIYKYVVPFVIVFKNIGKNDGTLPIFLSWRATTAVVQTARNVSLLRWFKEGIASHARTASCPTRTVHGASWSTNRSSITATLGLLVPWHLLRLVNICICALYHILCDLVCARVG